MIDGPRPDDRPAEPGGGDRVGPTTLRWWMPALIVTCGAAAYASSFGGVFLFDDRQWILGNPGLRQLWPVWEPISLTMRPVTFYSFAVNYAISGFSTWSWHLVNVAIHLLAALALFGVVRRSLMFASTPHSVRHAADVLALSAALVWVVHPLNTQAVTYIIQRSESLAALCYLTMLYCFIRGVQAASPAWYMASLLAFGVGLGSKEILLTAPLLLLLYDRSIITGSLRQSLRQRWPIYSFFAAAPVVLLAARWAAGLPSLYMFVSVYASLTGRRRVPTVEGVEMVPLAADAVTSMQYLVTQSEVILYYLRLVVWPAPLVFDYGWQPAASLAEVLLPVTVMLVVLTLVAWALWWAPRVGFVAAAVFVTLLPSSSVLQISDLAVEHRMYLPSAAVVTLMVVGCWTLRERTPMLRRLRAAPILFLAAVIGLLGGATVLRNLDYWSAERMWADVVAKRPDNPRAHYNYGTLMAKAGRVKDAIPYLEESLRLNPRYALPRANLGVALYATGRHEEALAIYEEALRLRPDESSVHNNLGMLLAAAGRWDDAIRHFEAAIDNISTYQPSPFLRGPLLAHAHSNLGAAWLETGNINRARSNVERALEYEPDFAPAIANLGRVLAVEERLDEALAAYRRAVALEPTSAAFHDGTAVVLLRLGRHQDALDAHQTAIRLDPEESQYRNNYGATLAAIGEIEAARAQYLAAIAAAPASPHGYNNLGLLLASRGEPGAAIEAFRQAVRADPGFAEAHNNIGTTLADTGRHEDAVMAYLQALFVDPEFARAHNNLAVALWRGGHIDDAVSHLREALRIRPGYVEAQRNLEKVLAGQSER